MAKVLASWLLMAASCGAAAQAPTLAPDTPAAARLAPAVSLVAHPSKFSILEDYVLEAKVVNETSKPISIRTAEVCFSPDFVRARGIGVGRTCIPMNCDVAKAEAKEPAAAAADTGVDCKLETEIAGGQPWSMRHYDRLEWSGWPGLARLVALLGWTERPVTATVRVEYSGADSQKYMLSREIALDVKASIWLIIVGSVIGSALLAMWMSARGEHSPRAAWKIFNAGAWTGVIVVMVIQRVGDLDLPFKFAVNDVLGGIIVGLFSFKLGKMLMGYFVGDPTRADGAEAENRAGPLQPAQELLPNETAVAARSG